MSLMAVTKVGKVVVHKAKRNSNLSFSKGKTWSLEDMRVVEVVGVSFELLAALILAHDFRADHDDPALPMGDGEGEGSMGVPQLHRQGVQDVYQGGSPRADQFPEQW